MFHDRFEMNFRIGLLFNGTYCWKCGPGSIVDIATSYGLDGPGIESR